MGIPTHIEVDRRIADAAAVRDTLESTDVTSLSGERLDCLHRLCYPAFRVTFGYTQTDDDDGFLVRNEQGRTDEVLIDGLWNGNDATLAPYTDGTAETETVPTTEFDLRTERSGGVIIFGFQATDDHARQLLPDRVERYTADNGYGDGYAADLHATFDFDEAFALEAFDDVVDVTRVYLPFWLAEFHDADEENSALRSFRTLEEITRRSHTHQWLADYIGDDPGRLAKYTIERTQTGDSGTGRRPPTSTGPPSSGRPRATPRATSNCWPRPPLARRSARTNRSEPTTSSRRPKVRNRASPTGSRRVPRGRVHERGGSVRSPPPGRFQI